MLRIGRTLAAMVVVALSSWSCSSTAAPDATPAVAAIVVSPAASTLALNAQLPLQAEVQDGSGTIIPGAAVTWTVQDPKIVSVSAAGVVTALAVGSSQVAANALGKSGIATITVARTSVANVVLLPNRVDLTIGATFQLSASALDANGTTMTDRAIIWKTSNPGVATVSTGGLITGVATGTATVTAASEGKSSTSTVTVSQGAVSRVDVTPATVSMQPGQTQQLVAAPKDAKGNVISGKTVVWASDNLAVATVNAGAVLARSAGAATITATVDGVPGHSQVSVAAVPVRSITVSPSSATLNVGDTKALSASVIDANGNPSNQSVTWSTNNEKVATVDRNTGVVKAVGVGTAAITAAIGSVSGASVITVNPPPVQSVRVSPPTLSLVVGKTASLSATVVDVTGATVSNPNVDWTSNNPAVASVNPSTGAVTAVGVGSATIEATSGGKKGSSSVTVTAPPITSVTISASSSNVTAGEGVKLTATVMDANGTVVTNSTVTWTSDDVQVAAPNSTGNTTADVATSKAGSATITASVGGVKGTVTITVNPGAVEIVAVTGPSKNLKPESTMQLTATALDNKGNVVPNQSFFWSSSNPNVASVSSSGLVTGMRNGNVTITAFMTLISGKSGSYSITVK
jgi:trimeric autotransporter adhesin